jgi:hypothetical protein
MSSGGAVDQIRRGFTFVAHCGANARLAVYRGVVIVVSDNLPPMVIENGKVTSVEEMSPAPLVMVEFDRVLQKYVGYPQAKIRLDEDVD